MRSLHFGAVHGVLHMYEICAAGSEENLLITRWAACQRWEKSCFDKSAATLNFSGHDQKETYVRTRLSKSVGLTVTEYRLYGWVFSLTAKPASWQVAASLHVNAGLEGKTNLGSRLSPLATPILMNFTLPAPWYEVCNVRCSRCVNTAGNCAENSPGPTHPPKGHFLSVGGFSYCPAPFGEEQQVFSLSTLMGEVIMSTQI